MKFILLFLISSVAFGGYIKESDCGVAETVAYAKKAKCEAVNAPEKCVLKPHKSSLVCKMVGGLPTEDATKKSEFDAAKVVRQNARAAKLAARATRRAALKAVDWDNLTNAQLKAIVKKLVMDKEL